MSIRDTKDHRRIVQLIKGAGGQARPTPATRCGVRACSKPAPGAQVAQVAQRSTSARWRQARYLAIQRRCISLLGDEFAYVPYTLAHFGATSLQALTDRQLEQTYRHMLSPLA